MRLYPSLLCQGSLDGWAQALPHHPDQADVRRLRERLRGDRPSRPRSPTPPASGCWGKSPLLQQFPGQALTNILTEASPRGRLGPAQPRQGPSSSSGLSSSVPPAITPHTPHQRCKVLPAKRDPERVSVPARPLPSTSSQSPPRRASAEPSSIQPRSPYGWGAGKGAPGTRRPPHQHAWTSLGLPGEPWVPTSQPHTGLCPPLLPCQRKPRSGRRGVPACFLLCHLEELCLTADRLAWLEDPSGIREQ